MEPPKTDPHYSRRTLNPKPWVLPPLSNSWIIHMRRLYIALNRTPNMDCYCVGAVPNLKPGDVGEIPVLFDPSGCLDGQTSILNARQQGSIEFRA